jgi:hypothetical protein
VCPIAGTAVQFLFRLSRHHVYYTFLRATVMGPNQSHGVPKHLANDQAGETASDLGLPQLARAFIPFIVQCHLPFVLSLLFYPQKLSMFSPCFDTASLKNYNYPALFFRFSWKLQYDVQRHLCTSTAEHVRHTATT